MNEMIPQSVSPDLTKQIEIMNLDTFLNSDPQKIIDIIQQYTEQPDHGIKKLRELSYAVAMEAIDKHETAEVQKELLTQIQTKIDKLIIDWLEEILKEMDLAGKIHADIEERQRNLSVLKIIRGFRCNYNCRFCLEQNSDEEQKQYLDEFASYNYSLEKLKFAMLYAKMAFQIKEINFSGGDPLVNNPKQLIEEIKIAKQIGFEKITILTNGALLTTDLIDAYCEAGLTNLSISLHTSNKENYDYLVMAKDKKSHYEHVVKMLKYASGKQGLLVRINSAKTKHFTEPIAELIQWAKKLGVQEITINEMIMANQFSIEEHEPINNEIAGYDKISEQHWGLSLFKSPNSDDPSVAICRFGKEDFASEQSKDLYLLPNGKLSQYLFEKGPGISY